MSRRTKRRSALAEGAKQKASTNPHSPEQKHGVGISYLTIVQVQQGANGHRAPRPPHEDRLEQGAAASVEEAARLLHPDAHAAPRRRGRVLHANHESNGAP